MTTAERAKRITVFLKKTALQRISPTAVYENISQLTAPMFRKLVLLILVTVGTIPAKAWADCGDLWAVSEAVPALCLRLHADRSSTENEIALVLIARGDWSWTRVDDADQCALRIEIAGQVNARDYHRSNICPIDDAGEYVACLERSLTHREQATCHLRHVAQ